MKKNQPPRCYLGWNKTNNFKINERGTKIMTYKINLHITQKCNYNCKYCFAHFAGKEDLSLDDWKRIIDNLYDSKMVDAINFAGGEPVLYRDFSKIVDYAYSKGFKLSIITNGSLMLNEKLMPAETLAKFDTLGISVDSIKPETLVALGACSKSHKVLTYADLQELIKRARKANPSVRIKLNTVITNINADEDLTAIGKELDIARWKILRMKLFDNDTFSNEQLLATDSEFENFTRRHAEVSKDVVVENDLTRSYIMVDNQGRLMDDEKEDYKVVGSLLKEPFEDVFSRYHFDEETYNSRYVG